MWQKKWGALKCQKDLTSYCGFKYGRVKMTRAGGLEEMEKTLADSKKTGTLVLQLSRNEFCQE